MKHVVREGAARPDDLVGKVIISIVTKCSCGKTFGYYDKPDPVIWGWWKKHHEDHQE